MNRICVYCGSNPGTRPDYIEGAKQLAQSLIARDIGLVYGGARVGIMGVIADSVLAAGGEVIGVIPESLMEREIAHAGLTELYVVGSLHERKQRMVDLSDGFVALPGGFGTMDELFEVLTWAQLGLHSYPCGLLNVSGYYDALGAFLDFVVEEGFVTPNHRSMLMVEESPDRLLDRFANYTPPAVKKWIDRESV